MRFAALAAAALGLALTAGVANAKTVTDPHGRFIVDVPASWSTTDNTLPANEFSNVIVGSANNECHILVFASANLAGHPARDIYLTGAHDEQFQAAFWTTQANAVGDVFPNNGATVLSVSSEHDHTPFPIQRAEITSTNHELAPPRTVHAALQLRPGFEIYAYCMTYGGADPVDTYTNVIRSIRHPNDTQWASDLAAQNAAHDAQAAAAAAAAAARQQQQGQHQQHH